MTKCYVDFEFDLPGALLVRLVEVFNQLTPAPLNSENIKKIPKEQGVYQLYVLKNGKAELVYIGKTDAKSGLQARLAKHAKKVSHRVNLNPNQVLFKAVRVYVFTALDLEAQLIAHYGGVSEVSWNGSGFGAKDPGKERDTTNYKANHFDTQFPIDLSRPISFAVTPGASAADVLRALKKRLPYLIRFHSATKGSRLAHADLESTIVSLSSSACTPEQILAETVSQLPTGWHATMLPSHIIVYKDDSRDFPSGRLIARI